MIFVNEQKAVIRSPIAVEAIAIGTSNLDERQR